MRYLSSIASKLTICRGTFMKVVAFVPMKLTNRRLPGKNIKTFTNGKPLCYYILSTLSKIEEINEIYVYCSSHEIQSFLPEKIKYLKRDPWLDRDETSISEVLYQFAQEIFADVYVLAHATAPFISADSIRKGMKAVCSNEYDSSFSAKKIQDFLWANGKPINYNIQNIPRTQDLPVIYEETSGFYIYRQNVVTELGRRIGDKPFIVEVGGIEGIDIDEEEDFILADAIYNYYKNNSDKRLNNNIV